MRIYKYFFFSIILVFAACISEDKVPNDVINEDRMTALMVDMHIINGDLLNVQQTPDTVYKYSYGQYQAAFKKYHTDSLQFKKSFTWYSRHPVMFDGMYDKVLKVLQTKTDSVAKLKAPPKPAAPVNNKPIDIPVKSNNVVPPK